MWNTNNRNEGQSFFGSAFGRGHANANNRGGFGAATPGFVSPSQRRNDFGGNKAPAGFGQPVVASKKGFGGGNNNYESNGGNKGFGNKQQASGFGSKQQASGFGSKPASGFGSKPASGFGNKPASGFGNKQQASGFRSKPASGFGSKPASGFGNKPASGFGNKQQASGFGSKPASGFGNKPAPGFGNKPASGFGNGNIELNGSNDGFGIKSASGFGNNNYESNRAKKGFENQLSTGFGNLQRGGKSAGGFGNQGLRNDQPAGFGANASGLGTAHNNKGFRNDRPTGFGGPKSGGFGGNQASASLDGNKSASGGFGGNQSAASFGGTKNTSSSFGNQPTSHGDIQDKSGAFGGNPTAPVGFGGNRNANDGYGGNNNGAYQSAPFVGYQESGGFGAGKSFKKEKQTGFGPGFGSPNKNFQTTPKSAAGFGITATNQGKSNAVESGGFGAGVSSQSFGTPARKPNPLAAPFVPKAIESNEFSAFGKGNNKAFHDPAVPYAGPTDLFIRVKGQGNNDKDAVGSLFSQFGPVKSVALIPNKGCAYISMQTHEGAQAAINDTQLFLNGCTYLIGWNKQGAKTPQVPNTIVDKNQKLNELKEKLQKKELLRQKLQAAERKRDLLMKQQHAQNQPRHKPSQLYEEENEEEEMEEVEEEEEEEEEEDEEEEMDDKSKDPDYVPEPPRPPRFISKPVTSVINREEESSDILVRRDGYLVGTCMQKCPAAEIEKRYNETAVHLLEREHPELPHLPPRNELMVKSFMRSSAGLKLDVPEMTRPEKVLVHTLDYIWTEILDIDSKGRDPRFRDSRLYKAGDGESPTVAFVFAFLSDRTRSIRKDFSLQGYMDEDGPISVNCIRVFEECARMHIMADEMLCESTKDEGHDETLNRQEANNCLKALNEMYVRAYMHQAHLCVTPDGRTSFEGMIKNEAEFRSYYLILQCGDAFSVANYIKVAKSAVNKSVYIQTAINVLSAYNRCDYLVFFSILKARSTPYLVACLMHGLLSRMWRNSITCLYRGSNPKGDSYFTYDMLVELLLFEDVHHAKAFCDYLNIQTLDGVRLVLGAGKLATPESKFPRRVMRIVESKRIPDFVDTEGILELPPRIEVVRGITANYAFQSKIQPTFLLSFSAINQSSLQPVKHASKFTHQGETHTHSEPKAKPVVRFQQQVKVETQFLPHTCRKPSQESESVRNEEDEAQRLLKQQVENRRIEMANAEMKKIKELDRQQQHLAEQQRRKEAREYEERRQQEEKFRFEQAQIQKAHAEEQLRISFEMQLEKKAIEADRIRVLDQKQMIGEDRLSLKSELRFRKHQHALKAEKRVWWNRWINCVTEIVATKARISKFQNSLMSNLSDGTFRVVDMPSELATLNDRKQCLNEIKRMSYRIQSGPRDKDPFAADSETMNMEKFVVDSLSKIYHGAASIPWKIHIIENSWTSEMEMKWLQGQFSMTGFVENSGILGCYSKGIIQQEVMVCCTCNPMSAVDANAMACVVPAQATPQQLKSIGDDLWDSYRSQLQAGVPIAVYVVSHPLISAPEKARILDVLRLQNAAAQVFSLGCSEFEVRSLGANETNCLLDWLLNTSDPFWRSRIDAVVSSKQFLAEWYAEIDSYNLEDAEKEVCFFHIGAAPLRLKRWFLETVQSVLGVPFEEFANNVLTNRLLNPTAVIEGVHFLCSNYDFPPEYQQGIFAISLDEYFFCFVEDIGLIDVLEDADWSTACFHAQTWTAHYSKVIDQFIQRLQQLQLVNWPCDEFYGKLGLPDGKEQPKWNDETRITTYVEALESCKLAFPDLANDFETDLRTFIKCNIGNGSMSDFRSFCSEDVFLRSSSQGNMAWNIVFQGLIEWKKFELHEKDVFVFDFPPTANFLDEWNRFSQPVFNQKPLEASRKRESELEAAYTKRARIESDDELIVTDDEFAVELKAAQSFEALLRLECEKYATP